MLETHSGRGYVSLQEKSKLQEKVFLTNHISFLDNQEQ